MEEEDTDVISSGFEVWFEELGELAMSRGKRVPMKGAHFDNYNTGKTPEEVVEDI